MKKSLEDKVNFANFCINNKLDALEVATLIHLVMRRVMTGTAESNGIPGALAKDDKACKKVEEQVKKMNLEFDGWPGLFPSIKKDGYHINLPY
jgi:hypothetical protein